MIVDDFRRETRDGFHEVSARLRAEHALDVPRLWFRFPQEYAPEGELDASPFLAGTLVRCLRKREPLTVDGPVSPRLLDNVDDIAAVLQSFYPGSIRGPVPVQAHPRAPSPGRELTASLFTRGLDSWYGVLTALEDRALQPPITHTVYAPGFNASDWSDELREAKFEAVRRASERVGLQVIRMETNVNRVVGHGQFAMALVLGLETVLIASGDMRGGIRRKGSHPFLDHRFSSERTEIVHYGEASRIQKAARVAQSQDALDTLDVCQYDHLEQDRNCARCEKCVRTMLELHALGALNRCPVFDQPLRVENVAAINSVKTSRQAWLEAEKALGDTPFDRRLRAAAQMVIFRSDLRYAATRAEALSRRQDLAEQLGDATVLAEAAAGIRRVDREVERRMAALTGGDSDGRGSARGNGAGNAAGRRGGLLGRLLAR